MELAIVLKITLPPKAPQIQLCGSLGSWRWNRKSPFLTYKPFVNWHRTTFWEEPRSFHCTGLASYCHSSRSYYHLPVQSKFLFLKLCCLCTPSVMWWTCAYTRYVLVIWQPSGGGPRSTGNCDSSRWEVNGFATAGGGPFMGWFFVWLKSSKQVRHNSNFFPPVVFGVSALDIHLR
jgi:hypothetical protein